MIITKTSKDLKPYVLDPKAKVIRNPYYMISEDEQVIYVIVPGLNGIEFNKTAAQVITSLGVTHLTCLYGQGILALQRNDEGGEAKEFKIVTLSSGRQIGIPVGWISSLINVGKGFLVVLKSGAGEISIAAVLEKRGLTYYVIEKKGEIGFEQNPKYRVHPQIATE